MNKRMKYSIISILLMIGIVFSLIGCNVDRSPDDVIPTLSVTTNVIELNVGETTTILFLTNEETEEELDVIFSIENSNVATVDTAGEVTGVGQGTTIVTVSLKDYPDVKEEVTVNVTAILLGINGLDKVNVGESITLIAKDENDGDQVVWESTNVSVATVDENGVVIGVSGGVVIIKATSTITGNDMEKEITVEVPEATSIEVNKQNEDPIKSFSEVRLVHQVLPVGASQEVIWTSSNEEIATVGQDGKVQALRSGDVEITVTTLENNSLDATITLNIEVDPIALLRSLNVEDPIAQNVSTYGNTVKNEFVYGSVSYYYPGDLNLAVQIINITPTIDGVANPYIGQIATQDMLNSAEFKTVRSGILKPEIKSIIYHDTGNNGLGADAEMHAKYIVGDANFSTYKARSWHYTVDEDAAIQHLPDNEVGWQGDTYEAYSTTIGIETSVDQGSDLYNTWHRTAKLIAVLLKDHNLKVTDVKQHYDYSQKNCPQTLRRSGLYDNAIELVKAEYLVLSELEGYTITFQSNAPEYVDDFGRIIKLDETTRRISYRVNISNNDGYNETLMLYTNLPAKSA